MEASQSAPEVYAGPNEAQADRAIEIIDEIITDIYLPFRGAVGYRTERETLIDAPHTEHRENNAEHSWHLPFTVRILWDQRESLGLVFPLNFNIYKAQSLALLHDAPEIWTGDVDAMTPDLNLLTQKSAKTRAAIFLMRRRYSYTSGVAQELLSYEDKDCAEAEYTSDVDKIVGTRLISIDNGMRWKRDGITRKRMCDRMRSKLCTPLGHTLFDAIERDLDKHPEYFPEAGAMPLAHEPAYVQDRLF